MMISVRLSALFLLLASSMTPTPSPSMPATIAGFTIIPQPASITPGEGGFLLNPHTIIFYHKENPEIERIAKLLSARVRSGAGFVLELTDMGKVVRNDFIAMEYIHDEDLGSEGYILRVTKDGVRLEANTEAGLFYAVQSFLQLLPPAVYGSSPVPQNVWQIPCVTIRDKPRFTWRGMMLDVSRHFFPKEAVKRFIDYMTVHKMNRFHWHLNDDQGWRIEIKKYPRLTEVGAWRVDREDIHWDSRPPQREGERPTYGGFYSQADIRDIVAYARERFITVVPEIEMPAHATSVLATYPSLSCTGGPFTLPPGGVWPITDIYCAGNDSTFEFLQNILAEVTELFPGEYLHIGGDEATKTEWKRCPKCQTRIRNEHLGDEAELQSYFIKRIEKFLVSKKKRLLGWDEILEGGLPAEATVMSWRGTAGGIAAARAGHDVVMSPNSFAYFDYYQSDPSLEPAAIGGFLPLKTVYSYEPAPDSLTPSEAAHILGVQANLWTEFVPAMSHVEYMVLPRMAAIAEVGWSSKNVRDWTDFSRRLETHVKRYAAMGANYARSAFTVIMSDSFDTSNRTRLVTLQSEIGQERIRYTVDGTEPTPQSPLYTVPLLLTRSAVVKAATYTGNDRQGNISEKEFRIGLPVVAPVPLARQFSKEFAGSGAAGLVDNLRATPNVNDKRWQGIRQEDFEAVVDLGSVMPIHRVTAGFLHAGFALVFLPSEVEFGVSGDGNTFQRVAILQSDIPAKQIRPEVKDFSATLSSISGRFVRIKAKSIGTCPGWHKMAGEPVWLFVDEVTIE